MKFCFLLGESAAETVLMLQEACKEEALSKTQVYEWYGVKCHVRTNQDLANLQPAKMMKILKKFAKQSMQINIGPLMRLPR